MFQIIDERGSAKVQIVPKFEVSDLKHIYTLMMKTRAADDKALKLQRQGRMGTYGSGLGQEACQVGTALAMRKGDWFFPYFRDLGVFITLGLPLSNYYLYWMGNEKGMAIPEDLNIFPISVPVGSQILHAVGAGMAANIRNEKTVIVSTFSDGATSEGDFHEGLNFAGVYNTPNIFVCFNNQYAISLPRSRQTASETIAQKASAYGFEGRLVDGNDVFAVYATVKDAADKARKGGGPTLIEAFTYRMSDHTTSDDASRYRPDSELEEWKKKDPIERFQAYLKSKRIWTEEFEKSVQLEVGRFVTEGVEEAEKTPPPSIEEMFLFTYEDMTPQLEEQLEELKASLKEKDR